MAFPPGFLDELRTRVSLTDLVGRRVRLVRRGREHSGLCPFHNEKTPSFYVVEDKGFFHCFGCGAHGDAIGFVMRYDNVDFGQAVEKLAGGCAESQTRASRSICVDAVNSIPADPIWTPIMPVSSDAPLPLRTDGWTVE